MGRKLFVGNLAFSIGETELKQLFEQKGGVESVTVMRDLDTGRSRGFAFVEMRAVEAAQKAFTELNCIAVEGRGLRVNEAHPKQERCGGEGCGFHGNSRGSTRDGASAPRCCLRRMKVQIKVFVSSGACVSETGASIGWAMEDGFHYLRMDLSRRVECGYHIGNSGSCRVAAP